MPGHVRLLAAFLIVASCAPLGPVDAPHPHTVQFRCEAGGLISATFTPRRARLVEAGGRVVELDQQPSGSGFRYESVQGELRGKGDEITWTPATAPPRTCVAARAKSPTSAPALDGTRWRLESLQSSGNVQGVTRPADPSRYTLEFTGDRAAMRLDCNRATATWRATPIGPTGGAFTFGPAAMTRAACPPGSLDFRIAGDLPRIRSYTLAGDTLSFALETDAGVYTWRRAP